MSRCDDRLAALATAWRGGSTCTELPDGRSLLTLPLTYSDGDHVEVLLRDAGDRLVATDYGTVAGRLESGGLPIDTAAHVARVIDIARPLRVEYHDGELLVVADQADVADAVIALTSAMLQVDALRVTRRQAGEPFATELTEWLRAQPGLRVDRAPTARGRSGKDYRLTAATTTALDPDRVLLQAVTRASNVQNATRSIDHAFRIFHDVNGQVPAHRKVVVLAEDPSDYEPADIMLFEGEAYVASWTSQDLLLAHVRDPQTVSDYRLFARPSALF